jgi:hypothetical protein
VSQETINILIGLTAAIAMAASPVLAYLLLRAYKASAKALNLPVNAEFVQMLEDLATLAVKYAEQEAVKWLNSQREKGLEPRPLTGLEKKELAVQAMQSVAPPGVKITPVQADIAIEAVVQKVKSLRPPPMSIEPGGVG